MSKVVAGSPLVVVGSSAGGVAALTTLVDTLHAPFPAPLVIAQHHNPTRASHLGEILARRSPLPVLTVADHAPLEAGTVYVVPANCHVQITDHSMTVLLHGVGRPKPSVDLLLSSAAAVYGAQLIAVILTGTGSDGAAGGRAVHEAGGTVVIQNPATAAYPEMPSSLAPQTVDIIADLPQIGPILHDLLADALQAANKELVTLNAQLRARLEELTTSNTDLSARNDDLQRLTEAQGALQHRLLQGVIGAQESERRRVARELHDDIGQELTALVLALGVIQQGLPESATRAQHILEDATGLAENMMSGLRRVITDLRPPVLDDLGLVPALRRLGSDLHERAGVAVVVQAQDTPGRLPPEVEITLFRVAQEALTNIGKHAHADQASILLRREPGQVTLRITDDGQGLPAPGVPDRDNAYRDGAHFGLLGMQERVALLNGVLRVEGAPDQGTTVSVELPLEGA